MQSGRDALSSGVMTNMKSTQPSAEPIYEALKAAIIAGELEPGEPLRQDAIALQHGVSKIPVREALLRLESDGFVLFRKNRGAIVREISATEILNLLDVRVALECKALELAVPNMIEQDFVLLRDILDEYSHETTPAAWSALNVRFHHGLYEPCGNPHLLAMIEDLRARIGPGMRLLVSETTGFKRPHEEHQEILALCKAGNRKPAVDLLRRHIETTRKEIAARMRRVSR